MNNPLHKKITKTLLYKATFQELADIQGLKNRQNMLGIMNKIPKKDKENIKNKRLEKIKKIMAE